MTPRLRLVHALCMAGALLGMALAAASSASAATSVTCIEASRYKHLYRIFGNDPARFAAFFGTDPRRLPHPEACRAFLFTGTIDGAKRGERDDDFTRLATAIASGNGWVSTLYLASPGGNVSMGLRLAQATRLFWLTTHAVDGPHFDYVPDFLGNSGPGSPAVDVPPELQNGWRDYVAATQGFARVATMNPEKQRPLRCVSACTYLHAAGVHRFGPAYFHRARRGRSQRTQDPNNSSMTDLLDRLHKVEQRIVALYRAMDTGDEAIEAYTSTATQTTASAELLPMPRYISDHLVNACRGGQRPRRSREQELAQSAPPAPEPMLGFPDGPKTEQVAPPPPLAGPPRAAPSPRPAREERTRRARSDPTTFDARTVQCQSANHTRERLTQFAKLCANGCDHHALKEDANRRVAALVPGDEKPDKPPRQRRPRDGGTPRGYPPQAYPPQSYPPPQRGYPSQPGYPPRYGQPQGPPPSGQPRGPYPPPSGPPPRYPPQSGPPPSGYPPPGPPPPGGPPRYQGGYQQ